MANARHRLVVFVNGILIWALTSGCSGSETPPPPLGSGSSKTDASTSIEFDGGVSPGLREEDAGCVLEDGAPCQFDQVDAGAICGNAVIDQVGEKCDDGNRQARDGCTPACQIEPLYICPPEGGPCTPEMVCGDGKVTAIETCDDGNAEPGDGCSANCQREASYYTCPPQGGPCVSTVACGDGLIQAQEICDDGNTNDGDGCAGNCLQVEPGWVCRKPAEPCTAQCGDSSILVGAEECDDGNAASGDGCSSTCRIEPGYLCSGTPSVCSATTCGDGVVEGTEKCDEGVNNGLFYGDGNGCSNSCTKEPACRAPGGGPTHACESVCGDGMKLGNEECDDGNLLDNDGCSSTCTVEQGFTCTEQTQSDTRPCTAGAGECLTLPIVLRDFKGQNEVGGHPDFFYMGAPGIDGETTYCVPNAACDPAEDLVCPDLAADITPRCAGLVMPNLNDQGKPAFNATNRLCDCVFTDWDGTGIINAVPGAAGTGPDGHDQVQATIPMVQSAETFAQWYTDVAGVNTVQRTVLELNYVVAEQVFRFSSSGGRTVLDDIHDEVTLASGFFPLENAVTDAGKLCNLWTYWVDWPSCAGNQYDMIADDGTWVASQGMLRNFYFTTEARYLMVYQGGESLRFFGDDDVWVFINGVLAVDLGGTHQQLAGSVTLATGGDARFGLEVGNTYEIVVFHADRHPRDSNYELTLSGFQTEISTCEPFCGDGIRTMMEECDAGMQNNDTDYGGCKVDCTYGPFCGDGILNGPELCDDGTNDTLTYNGDGCAPGCVPPPRCGDGVINDQREQCDDGENNNDAVPGGCSTECRINPKCGDGVVMYDSGEECDYGEDNAPPDQVEYGGCTTDCKLGPYCGDGVQTTPPELCDDGNAESGDGCSAACISEIVI